MFCKDSFVTLQPLTITKDKKHYIVENSNTGDFFEMPLICIDAIKMIQIEMNLGSIESELKLKYPNEKVDILFFVKQLYDMKLLASLDGKKLEIEKRQIKEGFEWVPVQIGKVFFNRVTTTIYTLIFILSLSLLVIKPGLLPVYSDLFIFDSMLLNFIVFILISIILLLIHEAGHILALRSFGFPTSVEISHRLFFLVLEADMTPSWKLRTSERNQVYLAGISFDLVILFGSFVLETWFVDFQNTTTIGILSMINLNIFLRILYQCCFYMKTDMYFVIENTSGYYNLMEEAKRYLSKKYSFSKKKKGRVPDTESFVKWYSYFYLGGTVLTIYVGLIYLLPQLLYIFKNSLISMSHPISNVQFWDGLVVLLQFIIIIGLLFFSLYKKTIKKGS
jgi:putative peptide zinc metalloprotease protein